MEEPTRPSRRSAVYGLVVVVCLIAALVVLARASNPSTTATTDAGDFASRTPTTVTTTTDPTNPPLRSAPTQGADQAGWTNLGSPNVGEAFNTVVATTTDGVVVWGGIDTTGRASTEGGVFRSNGWTAVASIEVGISGRPESAWNGRELFVDTGDPIAWSPGTNTWRSVGRPPGLDLSPSPALAAISVNDDIFVVARNAEASATGGEIVAYTYGADLECCRVFDDPPAGLTVADAVWSGEAILVVGAASSPAPETGPKAALASLDPESGLWSVLADPPFAAPSNVVAAWSRGDLFAWADATGFARWSPAEGWSELPDLPITSTACPGNLVPVDGDVLAVRCGDVAVWSSAADRWLSVVTPEPETGWGAAECIPADHTTSTAVQIWCASPGGNPTFWELDTTAYETGRFGPRLGTGSPWSLFPNPAVETSGQADMVWTGDELLILCGTDPTTDCAADAWGYDPDDGPVHRVSSGAESTSGRTLLWIGDRLVAVRGLTTAYDPFSPEWRATKPVPRPGPSTTATWTGSEVIFFGSERSASAAGVSYTPDGETWSNIAPAPIQPVVDPVVAWSGSAMYVVGGWTFNDDGISASQLGAAYDPATNTWNRLPSLPGDGLPNLPGDRQLSGHTGGWVNDRFIVIGAGLVADQASIAGFSYDPTTDTWSAISPPRDPAWPSDGFASSMSSVAHGDELAVFFPGAPDGVIGFYRPATDSWRYVEGAPTDPYTPQLVSGQFDDGGLFISYLTSSGTVVLSDRQP